MAIIGRLAVSLNLASAKFEKGLQRATRRSKRSSKDISKSFAGIATAAAAAFSLSRINDFTRGVTEAARRARVIGTTSKDYQLVSLALGQMGLDGDQAFDALFRVREAVGEFAQGSSSYVEAFNLIGISLQDIEKRSPAEQLVILTDALRDSGSEANRAFAGATILTTSYERLGEALDPTAASLGEVIKRLRAIRCSSNSRS